MSYSFISLCVGLTSAHATFFEDHARGWYWYEQKPIPQSKKRTPLKPLTPTQQMRFYQQQLKSSLNRALLSPTFDNVKAYQTLQQAWMNQSQRFAMMWKRVVFETPGLDETIQHPHMQGARHVYYDLKDRDYDEKLKKLSQTYGLFLFVKGSCRYCHGLAPVVQAFATRYNFQMMAVSLDGSRLPGLITRPDNGMATRLGVTVVPSLYAVDPATNHIVPIAHGMASEEDIKERLLFLTQKGRS